MKSLLLLTLFWISFLSTSPAENVKRFNTIVAQSAIPRDRNVRLIDFDNAFAWMGRHYGDNRDQHGNTEPGVFVYSKKHDRWLQILEVSTEGAKFGKQEDILSIPAPWNFTKLASQKTVPLPILTSGSIHLPDKVVYDGTRDTFVLYFDSRSNIESQTTTLLILKKDLMEAFDHFTPHP